MDLHETIYVIEDDLSAWQFYESVLSEHGYHVQLFSTSKAFLDFACFSAAGCVIADLGSLEIQCVEIQKELLYQESNLSLIPISSDDDDTAAQMIKHGAIAILQKPINVNELLAAVRNGFATSQLRKAARQRMDTIRCRLSLLTESERNVMSCLIQGLSHKSISSHLDLSPRSVDRRRKSILEKLNVPNVHELIRMMAELNVQGESFLS